MRKCACRAAALCLAAVLLAACAVPAQAAEEQEGLGAAIETFVAAHEDTTAGMAVSVFRGDGTVYENYFGSADRENGVPVEADTVFEWGSATKLLVWVSVMQLWEQGRLDLEADVRAYLPEGFLTNLRFDEPVTMLHLMNHNAGFQEMFFDLFLRDASKAPSLEEALRRHEPEQIYAPGTVTAYSNWGVALAGYIVERISGRPFYEYVRENIFGVLGMEHSALAPDLSDNEWVREKRGLLQCYTAEAELIPGCRYAISLYPAGMCTGTVGDFAAFGRALLAEDCPLFSDSAARDALFTPTSYLGDTDIPSNYHGFWMVPFGVQTVGHGGNTDGCSSYLLLDRENGIGAVVMTNQRYERVYNTEMMELIFGAYEPEPGRTLPRGVYVSARTFLRGPAKLESVGYTIFSERDLDELWAASERDGISLVSYPYGDLIKRSAGRCVLEVGLLLLWALGVLFSAGYLLAWPVGALLRRLRRREKPLPDGNRTLRQTGAGLQLALLLTVGLAVVGIFRYASSASYVWLFALTGLLALAMLPVLLALFLRRGGREKRKGLRALDILSAAALVTAAANVLYWNLFMFWAI